MNRKGYPGMYDSFLDVEPSNFKVVADKTDHLDLFCKKCDNSAVIFSFGSDEMIFLIRFACETCKTKSYRKSYSVIKHL